MLSQSLSWSMNNKDFYRKHNTVSRHRKIAEEKYSLNKTRQRLFAIWRLISLFVFWFFLLSTLVFCLSDSLYLLLIKSHYDHWTVFVFCEWLAIQLRWYLWVTSTYCFSWACWFSFADPSNPAGRVNMYSLILYLPWTLESAVGWVSSDQLTYKLYTVHTFLKIT